LGALAKRNASRMIHVKMPCAMEELVLQLLSNVLLMISARLMHASVVTASVLRLIVTTTMPALLTLALLALVASILLKTVSAHAMSPKPFAMLSHVAKAHV